MDHFFAVGKKKKHPENEKSVFFYALFGAELEKMCNIISAHNAWG